MQTRTRRKPELVNYYPMMMMIVIIKDVLKKTELLL